MENEVFEIIQSIRTVIDDVMTRIDAVEKRQSDLENMLFKEILDPLKEQVDGFEYGERLKEFKEKVGDKFDPFIAYAKGVNGEDYDLYKDMLDGYESWEDTPENPKPSIEDYIEGGVVNIRSEMEKLKETLNADTVEMKVDEDGVETKADGEVVPEEVVKKIIEGEEPAEETETADEEPKAEEEEVSEEVTEEEDEESEEEIQADLEMLEKEMEKYR